MPGKWSDYKTIKEKVSIEDVLNHYGLLDRFTQKGDQLSGCCPIHQGSRKSQFSVSLSKNAFRCFSTDCGAKGNQIDLVAAIEDVGFREAALLLQEWFEIEPEDKPGTGARRRRRASRGRKEDGAGRVGERPPKAENAEASSEIDDDNPAVEELTENKPLTFELNLDPQAPYLQSRGLTPETISQFGLGLCSRGSMKDRIAIPVHDIQGQLVAYAGRWAREDSEIPEGEGKYKLPAGFHKSLVVYNLQRIPNTTKQVILVEGFFSVFWLHQNGFPNVVSCMGSSMSREQLTLLADRLKGVQVFFDGDDAGETGALEVGAKLYASGLWCRMVRCPAGAQPDQLTAAQLKQLLT